MVETLELLVCVVMSVRRASSSHSYRESKELLFRFHPRALRSLKRRSIRQPYRVRRRPDLRQAGIRGRILKSRGRDREHARASSARTGNQDPDAREVGCVASRTLD